MIPVTLQDFLGSPPRHERLQALLMLLEIAVQDDPRKSMASVVVLEDNGTNPEAVLMFAIGPVAEWLLATVSQAARAEESHAAADNACSDRNSAAQPASCS